MAKCVCYSKSRETDTAYFKKASDGLLQCEKCGNIWSDDWRATHPITRSPFRLGLTAPDAVKISRRTGRELIQAPTPLNHQGDSVAQLEAQDLNVRWDLSDGVSLFFKRPAPKQEFTIYAISVQWGSDD